MLWLIAQKELKEIIRQGVLKILILTVLVLLLVSLVISFSYNRYIDSLHIKSEKESRELWDKQGDKNQHSAAHYGLYLLKPKSPQALWDNGLDRYTGAAIFIEPHVRNNTMFKAVQDSPMLAKWGEFTPSFIMLYILPLLILWITFNIISREKEQGTYRLLKSQGVSSLKWIAGKASAVWIITILLIVPVFLTAGIIFGKGAFFTVESFLLLLTYLLYAGIYIHIGIAVSALTKKSEISIIFLVGFWVLTTWVIPKITSSITQNIYPSPLESEFKKNIRDEIYKNGILRHDINHKNTIAFTKKVLKEYNVNDVSELPFNFNGYILQAAEDTNNIIFDKHYAELHKLYKKQTNVYTVSGLFSPFILARQISMGLCKTDLWSHINFTKATDEYRKLFIKTINEDLIKSPYKPNQRFIRSNDLWESIPKFKYKLPGLKLFSEHYKYVYSIYLLWFVVSAGILLFTSKKIKF